MFLNKLVFLSYIIWLPEGFLLSHTFLFICMFPSCIICSSHMILKPVLVGLLSTDFSSSQSFKFQRNNSCLWGIIESYRSDIQGITRLKCTAFTSPSINYLFSYIACCLYFSYCSIRFIQLVYSFNDHILDV